MTGALSVVGLAVICGVWLWAFNWFRYQREMMLYRASDVMVWFADRFINAAEWFEAKAAGYWEEEP